MSNPSLRSPRLTRRNVAVAAGLILVGSGGIQVSSALSASLFASYGVIATSALRMLIAAGVLLVLSRPRLRGRTRAEWAGIVVYGLAMAAMNVSLYFAIDRLPLGIAVTLEFLGPCAVALIASRRIREGVCALLALGGVALISVGPEGYFDLLGYLAGISAATFFGLYTLFADKVGKASKGLEGLALSVSVAAIVTLPFAAVRVADVSLPHWGLLAVSALIGVVLPYSVDLIAARITTARVVGTLFAIDPAMGSAVGFLILGETLTLGALAGIVVVAIAGALLVAVSGADETSDGEGCENSPAAPER